jgi:hypothetical protein
MKLRITREQFNELPQASREKMINWANCRRYSEELTIGQMLDLLMEHYHRGYQAEPMIEAPEITCRRLAGWSG